MAGQREGLMPRRIEGLAAVLGPAPPVGPPLGTARNPSHVKRPSEVNACLAGSASPYGGRFGDSGCPPGLEADPLTPRLNRS